MNCFSLQRTKPRGWTEPLALDQHDKDRKMKTMTSVPLPKSMGMSSTVRQLEVFSYAMPCERPVPMAIGTMTHRAALLIRITDEDGVEGWGEVWCNWPSFGSPHRVHWLTEILSPKLMGASFDNPDTLSEELHRAVWKLALQSGEFGPVVQCLAGVNVALWDLHARRAGQPLYRLLGGESNRVPAYASGIDPDTCVHMGMDAVRAGFKALKLKVGFDLDTDLSNLKSLRQAVGDEVDIMLDANQAWNLEEAQAACRLFEPFNPAWIEEPLSADAPQHEWRALASGTTLPVAAGENLRSPVDFEDALAGGYLDIVQPDLAKWGGISGCREIAQKTIDRGMRFLPHYFGAGVGLIATAHLIAAMNCDALLELDVNPNALRTLTAGPIGEAQQGAILLSDEPGLGVRPDLKALEEFRV